MPGIVLFQTNFSSGELDPLLRARTDLEQYQIQRKRINQFKRALNIYDCSSRYTTQNVGYEDDAYISSSSL